MTFETLVPGILAGSIPAVARAVSHVENAVPGYEQLLAALQPAVGHARRIGVTGPPGAGKSTMVQALAASYRRSGLRVAVLAVDPTSTFTGGALLGDRIRMESVAGDVGVYIRSMATRGALGGVAMASSEVCDVLDAAGFDRIIVETVGVGQSELDVATMTDVVLLVLVPESGDGIQALKSGVIEAADILVINKSDRPGADALRREIELSLDLRDATVRSDRNAESAPWRPPVLLTVATSADGVAEVVTALDAHWDWQRASGALASRRSHRTVARVRAVVDRLLSRWLWSQPAVQDTLDREAAALATHERSPYDVAAMILAAAALPAAAPVS